MGIIMIEERRDCDEEVDRFERLKTRYAEIFHIRPESDGNIAWLIREVETLRKAAHADQNVIQRLRKEVDHWVGVVKVMNEARAGDEYVIENQRLAALTGSLATEAEVARREVGRLGQEVDNLAVIADGLATEAEALKRQRDALQAKLARANQRAASRAGKVQTR